MKTTEQASRYADLDKMSVRQLLEGMQAEDRTIPDVVAGVIPRLEELVEAVTVRVRGGGRVFYLGAGTSGRMGVVDASEIPPTYGVRDCFIGLIAGGDGAIRQAVEGAEDDAQQGWRDMLPHAPVAGDTLVGIAASGTTPYVLGAVRAARQHGLLTACITCNAGTPLAAAVDIPVEAVVGPEFVTGSTRMKAGTCTKQLLTMFSTAVMIRLGHVRGSRMVDMQLTNDKLVDRGTRMVLAETGGDDYAAARSLLLRCGSVRAAVAEWRKTGW
ncbi:MAG: N-acetylmuramic acid 6-phosphate etherase [Bacteroidales bacterium]|nr:N-acetylmuramic acid 6-phosphate etherase [Bacteroidales bacterium]